MKFYKYYKLYVVVLLTALVLNPVVASEEANINEVHPHAAIAVIQDNRIGSFSVQDTKEGLQCILANYMLNGKNQATADDFLRIFKDDGYTVFTHPAEDESISLLMKGNLINIVYGGASQVDMKETCVKFFGNYRPEYIKSRAHRGFIKKFEKNWKVLYEAIRQYSFDHKYELQEMHYNVYGHSMGGALATLAGIYLAEVTFEAKPEDHVRVLTFGAPRVFDFSSAARYDQLLGEYTLRVVHENDITVPNFPTQANGSLHVGKKLKTPDSRIVKAENNEILRHVYPAYSDSLKQLTEDNFIESGKEYGANYYAGGFFSTVKSVVGLPRKGIWWLTTQKLISEEEQSQPINKDNDNSDIEIGDIMGINGEVNF